MGNQAPDKVKVARTPQKFFYAVGEFDPSIALSDEGKPAGVVFYSHTGYTELRDNIRSAIRGLQVLANDADARIGMEETDWLEVNLRT